MAEETQKATPVAPGEPETQEVVPSPCVSICALDENDICIGCFRSGWEISQWGRLDNEGKREVLLNVKARLESSS